MVYIPALDVTTVATSDCHSEISNWMRSKQLMLRWQTIRESRFFTFALPLSNQVFCPELVNGFKLWHAFSTPNDSMG